MTPFRMAQEQFRKMRCSHCQAAFEPGGVKLVREERDYWVVRVDCLGCGTPAGVAIVGVEFEGPAAASAPAERPRVASAFGSPAETARFAALGPITTDEVLDAHRFFRGLGADWRGRLARGA